MRRHYLRKSGIHLSDPGHPRLRGVPTYAVRLAEILPWAIVTRSPLRGDDGFLSGEALLFDPACDGIGFTLLDFFVMAEDFAESAFEKLT